MDFPRKTMDLVELARDLTRPMGPPKWWWFRFREITGYFREIDRLVKYYEPFGQMDLSFDQFFGFIFLPGSMIGWEERVPLRHF